MVDKIGVVKDVVVVCFDYLDFNDFVIEVVMKWKFKLVMV